MSNLHDRWVKDCATFRELYDQVQDLDLTKKIDWGPLLDEKLVGWCTNASEQPEASHFDHVFFAVLHRNS